MGNLVSEVESIRRSARQQGLEDGRQDGIALGLEKEYKVGYWELAESDALRQLMEIYSEKIFE